MGVVLWDVQSGESKIMPWDSSGAAQIRFSEDGRKLTTVHGFHGEVAPFGREWLAYPKVRSWEVGQAK